MDYYEDIFARRPYLDGFDLQRVPSASYVIDLKAVERNLDILDSVQKRTGAKILLALKGVTNFSLFPLISQYLQGCCASSPHEARLAREEFGKEVHSYAPASTDEDISEHLELSDHIVFNSIQQWKKFKDRIASSDREIGVGLRVNPGHSETEVDLYNPCAAGSRLGITHDKFSGEDISGVDGLHFHTLCQKGSDALYRTAMAFEEKFGEYLGSLKWINFGGGHHITQADYDIDLLWKTIDHFKNKCDLDVYLEPGVAIGITTVSLICSVLEIV